jgi:hypothetical protein
MSADTTHDGGHQSKTDQCDTEDKFASTPEQSSWYYFFFVFFGNDLHSRCQIEHGKRHEI